jgi:hypothetical protein
MTKKQIDFLDNFHSNLLNPEQDKFLTGTKYKNGNQVLDAHDLSPDQWVELVSLNDYPGLWNDASKYLSEK